MTALSLYPHQKAAIKTALDVTGVRRKTGLIALPTGTGKTVLFCELARRLHAEQGWGRTLILVHREELVKQTIKTLEWIWPAASRGIIKAGTDEWNRQTVVASVQSLHADRLERYDRDLFDLVIVDECHHAPATSYMQVLDWFNSRFVLGVTATPERHDGQGLDYFGDRPIYHYPLRRAIKDGLLVNLRQYGVETGISLDDVKRRMGRFVVSELSAEVNTAERNRVAVEAYLEHCDGRRAIVFCVDRQHIQDMTAAFNDLGVSAAYVDGELHADVRAQNLADFRAGRYRAMVSCEVLTEGFDDPGVSAVVMARPTGSRPFYTQCVGRALRLCPDEGKTDAIVLDLTDNSRKHKLVTALNLLGKPDESEMTDANGRDVISAVDEEIADLERQAKVKSVRPLAWAVESRNPWPELPTLAGYVPGAPWQAEMASPKQAGFISSFGVEIERELTKGEASWLINQCLELDQEMPILATPGQRGYLVRRGILTQEQADTVSKRDASKLIAKNEQDRGPEPASQKQIAYLRRLRALPADYSKLTLREAVKLISKAKVAK